MTLLQRLQAEYINQFEGDELASELMARRRELVALVEAARALHEEVEMAESVGICLPDRVPSLRCGAAVAVFTEDKP